MQLKWSHQFQFAGFYAAQANGYYRDAGLEVELREARPGLDITGELLAGRADYLVNNPSVLLERAAGKPLVALAAILQHSPLILVTHNDPPLMTPTALVGKRVMYIPETEAELLAMWRNEGVDLELVQHVPHTWNIDDLVQGRVVAMSAYLTDVPFQLERRGVDFQMIRPLTYGIDFYGDVLFTHEGEVTRHPQRVATFLDATLRGWKYAMQNPEEIISLIRQEYGSRLTLEELGYEAETMQKLMLPTLVEVGHMNPGRWQHIADTYKSLGMLPSDFELEGFLYRPDAPNRKLQTLLMVVTSILFVSAMIASALLYFNRRLHHAVTARTAELSRVNQDLYREIDRRQAMNDALQESDLRFRTLVDNVPGVVYRCAWNERRSMFFISDAIEGITGYEATDFLEGQALSFSSLVFVDDHEQIAVSIEASLRQGRPYALEYRLCHRDGGVRWVHDKGLAVYDVHGKVLYLDGVLIDITERRLAEETLQKLDKMKNEFISTAAHELRTPLTTIMGYSECLVHPEQCDLREPEQMREFAAEIFVKSEVLAGIVDELLDISRIEQGQPLSLKRAPCDVVTTVEQVARQFQLMEPTHYFECDLETLDADEFLIDRHRLVQVLENLLSNAVKYSPDNDRITISGRRNGQTYELMVADQGIGMDEEHCRNIFDKFYRVDSSNTAVGGLGLGMSIVRQIVQAHRGRIEVKSRLGEGTTITCVLPLGDGDATAVDD